MDTQTISSKYMPGELIHNRYRVVKMVGQGGMAEVYKTEDTEMHNRPTALKLLFSHISTEQINIERFIREVEITQKHIHPNIVRAHHYGKTEKNEQYFTMEYVEGQNLAELLKSKRKLEFEDVFYYVAQVASALASAHSHGIIHRDIKPDNIIVTKDGLIHITDFGIAKDLNASLKLTELEKGPKSYAYKAPELYVKDYDSRVDIYSLGITAFELLTGALPFQGERHQLLVAHLTMPIPKFAGGKSGIPAWFQEFVETCTAKKPENRFGSAYEVCDYLKTHGGEIPEKDLSFLNEVKNLEPEKKVATNIKRSGKLSLFLNTILVKYAASMCIAFLVYFLFIPLAGKGSPLSHGIIGDSWDFFLMDSFFKFRGAVEPPKETLVISIDETSYDKLGLSILKPWPRAKMAELLEKLRGKNPKMIVLDFVYPKINDSSLVNEAIDNRLADAMKINPTYVSRFLNFQESISNSKEGKQAVWISSDKLFLDSAKGEFSAIGDDSGVVRRFYFGVGMKRGLNSEGITPIANLIFGDEAAGKKLPREYDMINFYGPAGTITNIPFYKVLEGNFKDDFFNDKIIFIGQKLSMGYEVRQRDTVVTPYRGYTAGVEVHATTAGNILHESWIKRLPLYNESSILFIAALLFSYFIISVSPSSALVTLLISFFSWFVVSYYLFINNIFFPGLLITMVALPLSYLLSVLRVYLKKKETDRVLGIDKLTLEKAKQL
jgi:serine/threonine protein kinase